MSGVDNRIVTMQFNNRQFEQDAAVTLTTLQKLKQNLNFGEAVGASVRGIAKVTEALGRVGLKTPFAPFVRAANTSLAVVGGAMEKLGMKNPFMSAAAGAAEMQKAAQVAGGPAGMGVLEGGVTAVSNKFLALTTIAVTALANITNKAVNAATSWVKSFTFGPLNDGLKEYELNLKSIQTIQANTDRPLKEIETSLQELNRYSDQTIYNFSQMAQNIGTFTAAGVDLKTATSSIKGIANLAAMSGSNSQQASTAMYQLSQAIAAGKVGLQDWNSVVHAGMGGKKLQNALAQTAVAMGQIDASQVKGAESGKQLKIMGDSFRESIMAKPGRDSWLTSDILVNTLAVMDGRFSDAALAAEKTEQGLQMYSKAQRVAMIADARAALEKKNGVKYTNEQFEALQKMSTSAFKAATEVKTLGGVFEVAKETLASGWSASFNNIFGNLEQSKKLFTGMSNGLNGILGSWALTRNTLLKGWADLGGRTAVIKGLVHIWEALSAVGRTVRDAFRDIFPAKTAMDLAKLSQTFRFFTEGLKPGWLLLMKLRTIFKGLFSILSIGKTIFMGLFEGVKVLFGALSSNSGGFLNFIAGIAESITRFDEFLQRTGLVKAFFVTLGSLLSAPIALLSAVAKGFGAIFSSFGSGDADSMNKSLDGVGDKLESIHGIGDRLRGFFEGLGGFFVGIGASIGRALGGIGDQISKMLTPETFVAALEVIQTALMGGIVLMIKNLFGKGNDVDISGGLFSNINEVLGETTATLKNMQGSLKSNILLKLGIALGVMAGALFLLSTIDPGALRNALGAMATGFGILATTLVVLMKYMGPVGIVRMYAVTAALLKMSLALMAFSIALKILSSIKFGDMARGLVGLGALLWILNKALDPLAKNSPGMLKAAGALILVGIAINILAVALKIFATMSLAEIGKGLLALAGSLGILVLAMKAIPALKTEAFAIMQLAVAVAILAVAMKVFASMSLEEIGRGLLALAGTLGLIAGAMRLMPKNMVLQATAIGIVAASLVILAGALRLMGGMSPEQIAAALVALGGSFLILGMGLFIMGKVGLGAAAVLAATAIALAILVPALAALGSLSLATIATALGTLAAVFVVLGVAGYLLAPVVPVVLALAAALVLIGAAALLAGVGIALIGAGVLMTATALGVLASAGIAAVQLLLGAIAGIISMIPEFMSALGAGIVAMVQAIGNGAPKMATAFGKIINNLLDQVIKAIPKLGKVFLTLINTALKVISVAIPRFINTGLRLIVSFLSAISKNLPKIIDLAADIIVKFVNGIARNLPRIIQSGVNLILSFLRGLTQAINNNSEAMGRAGADLGIAIVRGMASGISGGAERIKEAALSAAKKAFQAVKDFFNVNSPSRLMRDEIGAPIAEGMAVGIEENSGLVSGSIVAMGQTAVGKLKDTMSRVDDAFGLSADLNPTISPVLDLAALTKEANKMGSILAVAPIMPTVSYRTAADISAATSSDEENGPGEGPASGGDTYYTYEHHLHSPMPLDSTKIYRDGKSLIALKKEEVLG